MFDLAFASASHTSAFVSDHSFLSILLFLGGVEVEELQNKVPRRIFERKGEEV
jgi:hypothetical protein